MDARPYILLYAGDCHDDKGLSHVSYKKLISILGISAFKRRKNEDINDINCSL